MTQSPRSARPTHRDLIVAYLAGCDRGATAVEVAIGTRMGTWWAQRTLDTLQRQRWVDCTPRSRTGDAPVYVLSAAGRALLVRRPTLHQETQP